MKENIKTIALDFDGVIHKYSKAYHDGTIYDEPVEGVKEAIRLLRAKPYKVVVFSVRNIGDITEWLHQHKIEVDEVTNRKPRAVAYIDDRGIRFTNWRDILNYF